MLQIPDIYSSNPFILTGTLPTPFFRVEMVSQTRDTGEVDTPTSVYPAHPYSSHPVVRSGGEGILCLFLRLAMASAGVVIRASAAHRAEQLGSPGMHGRRDTGKLSRNVAGSWVSEPSCNLTLRPSGLSLESHAGIF